MIDLKPENLGLKVVLNIPPTDVEKAIEFLKAKYGLMGTKDTNVPEEVMTIYRVLLAASVAYNKITVKQKSLFPEAEQLVLFPDEVPKNLTLF